MVYSEFGTGDFAFAGTVISEHVIDGSGGYARGPERALLSELLF
jgi:hypothetical protein